MQYRRLGKTDLIVSEVGFGTWAIGGNKYGNSYGPTDDNTSLTALRVAIELGCNLFDTADVYGHGNSEMLLGRALREAGAQGERIMVASKVGTNFTSGPPFIDFSRAHILRAVEATLRRLGRDFVDLYQLHNPPLDVIRSSEAFDALAELKLACKVRHVGVSVHTVEEAAACIEGGRMETLQIVYNLFSMMSPSYSFGGIFEPARRLGVGLIAREPLAGGFLSGLHNNETIYGLGDVRGDYLPEERRFRIAMADSLGFLAQPGVTMAQAALRFVLDEPAIATTIVGIKTPSQAIENFAAADAPCFEALAGGARHSA
jgi:aryl-alcohol dehydrogenase-like predicted oxidoreductase